jgi:hypothetical protein
MAVRYPAIEFLPSRKKGFQAKNLLITSLAKIRWLLAFSPLLAWPGDP